MAPIWAALLVAAAIPVTWSDLPPAVRAELGTPESQFDRWRDGVDRETAERLRAGEDEHLVYYALESRSFTRQAPIEPALSARKYFEGGKRVAPAVERRFRELLAALPRPGGGPRLDYFRRSLAPSDRTLAHLDAAYREAMTFLYDKEVLARPGVYETRGHSSDTRLASSYTVWNALEVLKSIRPEAKIERVLIVGPGVDFAPRTDLNETVPPQSYQPYAIAAALPGATIDCVDINPRVIDVLRHTQSVRIPREPGSAEFERYGAGLAAQLRRSLPRVSAGRLNIVTERVAGAHYDLVVATNVLLYFPPRQLLVALANIAAMLAPGGHFIHNDLRPDTERFTNLLGLKTLQGRTVLIGEGAKAPLYDTFALLEKLKR